MGTPNDLLQHSLQDKSPLLVIGAGFSLGSINKNGEPLPKASTLAEELFFNVVKKLTLSKDELKEIQNDENKLKNLRFICNIISDERAVDLRNDYLTQRMHGCHCKADDFYMLIKEYPWRYIFSLNIDDLVEFIYATDFLSVQINEESNTGETTAETTLIKLHGSVTHPQYGYIFDNSEYRHFSATEKWSLMLFGLEYVRNDVIFLGTEFQEDDLLMMIDKFASMVHITKQTNCYFVTPHISNRTLRRKIEQYPNMHHINMTAEEFLHFTKNQIIDVDKKRKRLRAFGMAFLDEKIRVTPKKHFEDVASLYLGEIPDFQDFFEDWDIPYPMADAWIENIVANSAHRLLLIYGDPYVGKSCVAMRTIVSLQREGFYACSFPMNSSLNTATYYRIFIEFLSGLPDNTKCAVLAENMPYYYGTLKKIISQCPRNVTQLVVVVTGNTIDHLSKKYIFDDCDFWEEHKITEHISRKYAENIYDKLKAKNHLNKLSLYASNRNECVRYIRELDDIVEVLFVANEGRKFVQHFADWITDKNDGVDGKAFATLCLFAELGIYDVSASFFSDIMVRFGLRLNYDKFVEKYSDYLSLADGSTHIRCLRIIKALLPTVLTVAEVQKLINQAASMLAFHLAERDESVQSEIFQKLIKVKRLRAQSILKDQNILDLLVEIEKPCEHLSYYWIQRGIVNRDLTFFEEANNALAKAADIRGHLSYHIQHAQAKNYMEWGIWEQEHGSSRAQYYFDNGREQLKNLILFSPKRFFSYSIHSYVDMQLKYFSHCSQIIDENEVSFIKENLKLLVNQKQDTYSQQIIRAFLHYCQKVGIDISDLDFLPYLRESPVPVPVPAYDIDDFDNDVAESDSD